MRTIHTGHGVARTALKPADIAGRRSLMLDSFAERALFRDWFDRYRDAAVRLWSTPDGPFELESLAHAARGQSSVHEAALIEALASLRAEGARL